MSVKKFCATGKTGDRTALLASFAQRLLVDFPRDENNPWIIAVWKPRGNFNGLQQSISRIRTRIELPEVGIHDFWHSFASRTLALAKCLQMFGRLLDYRLVQLPASFSSLEMHLSDGYHRTRRSSE